MTETTAPVADQRPRRWLWIALVASLAVNALLVGVVARSIWGLRANLAISGGSVDTRLPAFVSTLSSDRREALRGAASERQGALRPLRQEIRRARVEAARAFVADPFDKPAFMAAQKRMFDAESQLRAEIQRILPDIGERMTVAERRAYIGWRGFRRGGGRGGDGEGEGRRFDDSGSRRP